MKQSTKNYDVARALSAAFDPLIDVCLQLGITSPELESLLRSAFVQRAFDKLPPHSRTGSPPTTNKVSVATGVHRNEVSKIRAGGSAMARETMQIKGQLYSKTARVLHGWSTDPRFTASGGSPLDLPLERNKQRRSFEDLVDKYAPGSHPGTVLKELRRRGNVELLDGDILRFKSASVQAKGVTPANVSKAALRMNRLGKTLFQKISDPEQARLYEETGKITLSARQMEIIRPILEERAKTFIKSVESEFVARGVKDADDQRSIGVGVFSWDEG
jgi:Family of unknown function (DUF6502)